MNILHVLEDFSIKNGGITTLVGQLHEALNKKGLRSFIMSPNCTQQDPTIFPLTTLKPWGYSKYTKQKVAQICKQHNIDVIHIHGVWQHPQYAAAQYAIAHNIPYIVSPHGMFEPWIWTQKRLKKKLYIKAVLHKILNHATVFHAVTNIEKGNLQLQFPNKPVIEIPNLINANTKTSAPKQPLTQPYILFLGRLHEVKGIDLLLQAFSEIDSKNFKLKIAGGENTYSDTLKKLVKQLEIQNKVEFLGLIEGEAKDLLYAQAHVFVAPSHTEVVGMVNLEAAMQKTPVITTNQTGLKLEWNNAGGILINPNLEELKKALKTALNWTPEERQINGEKLYQFVLENYTWTHKTSDWVKLYNQVVKQY